MKTLIRPLSFLLLFSLLFLLVSCGTAIDRAEKKLLKEGYTVLRYGEGSPNPLTETHKDVKTLLKANRKGVWLHVYEFYDEKKASAFCDLLQEESEGAGNMSCERDGCTVFHGMREAYELLD